MKIRLSRRELFFSQSKMPARHDSMQEEGASISILQVHCQGQPAATGMAEKMLIKS
jgi:hypothetical protein